jgi:PAS domain S-box-containing protein
MPTSVRVDPVLFHYDTLLSAVSNGIVAINHLGRIVQFNHSAEQIFEISADEALGRPILEVLPNTGGKLLESMKSGKTFPGYKLTGEYVTLMANISPIFQNDRAVGAVSVFQKLSEFEDIAKQLETYKRLNRQLNAVFESSYDGLFITDGSGIVLKLNQSSERLNSHDMSQVIGKHITDIVDQGYIDRSVTMEVLRRKAPLTIMQRLRNGRHIIVTGTPVFDEGGNIDFVVTNERDITYLNLMKSQLQSDMGASEIAVSGSGASFEEKSESPVVAVAEVTRQAVKAVEALAKFDTTLLLLGESGVGKSFFANYIHKTSHREKHRFVKINCGAIPENLMESELFGYKKGAFTGADSSGKAGLVQIANQGTLFLDEIGELSPNMQVKLLTLLEDKEIIPVGGTEPIKVDVRIIAATNSDLKKRVEEGSFRQDLYYRLNIVPIQIPPLRERREDIPALIQNFLFAFNRKHQVKKSISTELIDLLCAYNFRGNIRELQNIIERLIITSPGDEIRIADLSQQNLLETEGKQPEPSAADEIPLRQRVEEYERTVILEALERHGNKHRAARALGIDPSTLGRKARKYLIPSGRAILH